ncbi:apolipoprotein N-acyltransferase [Agaricicola taiwanensis]|uniref:Apolipoprotein N-acyltransferase n=1 Tax=Agaricicola taiwanensis TaxID=591372 RepID=A0A8J2YFJ6_9RHOB|nr:apolipoprotein N-acyltransferase [Agaricicola taiwanensis]GGE29227.1 apolipoprotein N-acyltransferase [Agaricicola taiwanensis]
MSGVASALVGARDRVTLQWGIARAITACAAGALGALAMAPIGAFPVLILSFAVLTWLIDGAGAAGGTSRAVFAAARSGWWFGFGYFLAGLWWTGAAFLVDAEAHAWLMPFAVIALPAGLAFFHALGAGLARLLWSAGSARIFALAGALGVAEWLRGHILTGFPWNSFGYALADNQFLGQAASIIGLEGLTVITILVFAAPATLLDAPRRWAPTALAAVALIILAGFGILRLQLAEPAFREDVLVRIMQPNVQQDDKFRPSEGERILQRYLTLSEVATGPERSGIEDVTLLVWPESAFPFLLSETPEALGRIGQFLPDGVTLVTGAVRAEGAAGGRRYFNSIHAVSSDGAIIATYDKLHLVPFGEFLPFQSQLEAMGITQITRLPGGFSWGRERRSIALSESLTATPLICYEAIFPNNLIGDGPRPDMLLNVTNDGWFGATTGPYQHLAQSRVRAIEQGLPLIRAANTGVSAVVDPYGRILAQMPLGTSGSLDAVLPAALPATLFAQGGWASGVILLVLCFVSAVIRRRNINQPNSKKRSMTAI